MQPNTTLEELPCQRPGPRDEASKEMPPIPELSADFDPYDEQGWQCSPESLRGHIVNQHLTPLTMNYYGIPKYDIGIATHRGVPLNWVVEQAYHLLEQPTDAIERLITEQIGVADGSQLRHPNYSADLYRRDLACTLRHIEEVKLAMIDWNRVERSVPGARYLRIDWQKDSVDLEFNPPNS